MIFEIKKAVREDVPFIENCVEAAYQHYIERMGKRPGPMLDDYAAVVRDHHVFVVKSDGDDAAAGTGDAPLRTLASTTTRNGRAH